MHMEISRRFEFSSALRLFRRDLTEEENTGVHSR